MFEQAIESIKSSNKIAILPHVSADGDSIGSSLAICMSIKQMGKTCDVYFEEPLQNRYDYMYSYTGYYVIDDELLSNIGKYDLCIALDCGDKARLGIRSEIFDNADLTISVDHHISNTEFADINYVSSEWAATCEAVLKLINELGTKMNTEIATALYTGVYTDTGGFKFSNTSIDTHLAAAELLKYEVDTASIAQKVFDTITLGRLRLNAIVADKLEMFLNNRVALCYITKEDYDKCGATDEDADGISNYLRSIEGVEVGVFVKDVKDNQIKISLRSNNYADVAKIAQRFSGGGHVRAAGASINAAFSDIKDELIKALELEL